MIDFCIRSDLSWISPLRLLYRAATTFLFISQHGATLFALNIVRASVSQNTNMGNTRPARDSIVSGMYSQWPCYIYPCPHLIVPSTFPLSRTSCCPARTRRIPTQIMLHRTRLVVPSLADCLRIPSVMILPSPPRCLPRCLPDHHLSSSYLDHRSGATPMKHLVLP